MNQTTYDVLTCAAVLPTAGLDYNLFLKCMPNDEMLVTTVLLAKEKTLGLHETKIILNYTPQELERLHEHENPTVLLLFLEGLLNEMKGSHRVEENRDYISILHIFLNACKQFSGRSEELDDQLAELLASLVNLLDEPMIHFVKKVMDFEAYDRGYLDVLCSAEASLALKTFYRGLEEEADASRKLRLYRFTYDSLQAVSALLHGPLGPNEATETVDELLRVLEGKVSEWEPVAEIEVALRELEKECGIVPDSE